MSETWAVVDDEGTAHEVSVDEGRGSSRSWWAATPDVARRSHASARDAVVLVAQACEWAVAEVLAPGVETRAGVERERDEARASALAATRRAYAIRDVVAKGLEDRATQHRRSGDVVVELALSDAAAEIRALPLPGGAQ